MDLIMDGLLAAGALFAGTYCWVLSRRVAALKNLDSGLGGAITQMTRALEDARRALEEAKAANREGRQELKQLITRAEAASGQLRILLAASRDLPEPARPPAAAAEQAHGSSAPDAPREPPAAPDPARPEHLAPVAAPPAAPPEPAAAPSPAHPEPAAAPPAAHPEPADPPAPAIGFAPRSPAPAAVPAAEPAAAPGAPAEPAAVHELRPRPADVVPKPRRIFPIETLRPRPVAAPAPGPAGEAELIAELSALATRSGT